MEAKKTAKKTAKNKFGFEVGEKYFIRTCNNYFTGRVAEVNDFAVVLEDAAWIADTGRYHNFLRTGAAGEVEPYIDNVNVPLHCITDFTKWKHDLPLQQK